MAEPTPHAIEMAPARTGVGLREQPEPRATDAHRITGPAALECGAIVGVPPGGVDQVRVRPYVVPRRVYSYRCHHVSKVQDGHPNREGREPRIRDGAADTTHTSTGTINTSAWNQIAIVIDEAGGAGASRSTGAQSGSGGGGTQSAGGSSGPGGTAGNKLIGGKNATPGSGGGSGYYGGGAEYYTSGSPKGAGGGSGYIGHARVSDGAFKVNGSFISDVFHIPGVGIATAAVASLHGNGLVIFQFL
jgi:hypothetical protein